ncbi:hypothetical protein SDC9_204795 [bioreactor metagenome]|uniref:Uncharacterized protein n=1 Tax=bioreactor metagenome TaxID=1076179 RepID=A0A645J0J1_9ZZZZ
MEHVVITPNCRPHIHCILEGLKDMLPSHRKIIQFVVDARAGTVRVKGIKQHHIILRHTIHDRVGILLCSD